MSDEARGLLHEQQAYYDARAAEYDDWWLRRGEHDLGPLGTEIWHAEAREVQAELSRLVTDQTTVLEIAAGTGVWTRLLLDAPRLVVIDGSSEMLSRNPASAHPDADVRHADLWTWNTPERFDLVVAAHWLSHVPESLEHEHLSRLASWLRPDGALWFVDSAQTERTAAVSGPDLETRSTQDGRSWTIVKRYREPEQWAAALEAVGLQAQVRRTQTHFVHGTARRAQAQQGSGVG